MVEILFARKSDFDAIVASAADISTLAGIAADITTVAGISANVTTAAGISADITTVAGISGNVTTVAGISANVTTVAGISANVTTVAGISADVTTVAAIPSGEITTVAGISANVTTVAGISANITTVAGISGDVTTVAGISTDVTTVAGVSADVSSVAAISYKYLMDTSTSMADPGTGDVRFNNATPASITQIAISNTPSGGADISPYIITWDDSTNTALRGTLQFKKGGDSAVFMVFSITGAITDNGAWLQIPVAHVAGGTLPSASDALFAEFVRTGNVGTTTGDVVGPSSATNNALVRFDTTTGKLVQDSGWTLSDTDVMTGVALTLTTKLAVAEGGTGSSTASAARTALGVAIGTDVLAFAPSVIAIVNTGATAGQLSLEEPNGDSTVTLTAPALAGNYTLTLPVDDGTANQVLSTDGSGVLSWVNDAVGAALGNANEWTAIQSFVISDAGTTTVVRPAIVSHNSSGTVAAGFGVGLQFNAEVADGEDLPMAFIDIVSTDVGAGSEDFDFVFKLATAGAAPAEVARFSSLGELTLDTPLAAAEGGTGGTLGLLIMAGASAANVATGTTKYSGVFSSGAQAEIAMSQPLAFNVTISRLFIHVSTAPTGSETHIVTVRKNGSDQSLTVTLTSTATTGNDTSNSFTAVAGDEITVSLVGSAGAVDADCSYTLKMVPS